MDVLLILAPILVSGAVYLFVRLRPRQTELRALAVASLGAAARGLGFEPAGSRFHKRVSHRVVLELSGAPPYLRCTARWQPALAFELRVVRYAGHRAASPRTGDELDRRFVVETRDHDYVDALMRHGLEEALLGLDERTNIELDARGVALMQSVVANLGDAQDLCSRAATLACTVLEADQGAADACPDEEIAAAWAILAEQIGARFDPGKVALVLGVALGTLRARVVKRHDGRHPTRIAELAFHYKRELAALEGEASATRAVSGLVSALVVSTTGIEARVEGSRSVDGSTLREILEVILSVAEELSLTNRPVDGYRD